ncbi:MAG: FHA domain-containing protein [Polyangiaceae bacterium]
MQHDLELAEGEFVVGRNASCQLSLDDPLVSRRHARLLVGPTAVTIEDLQSRNGVLVNGQRISERLALEVGDRVLIGTQELTLLAVAESNEVKARAKVTMPKMPTAAPTEVPAPPAPAPLSPPTPIEVSNVGLPPSRDSRVPEPIVEPDYETSMVRRADAFNLLAGVAEKALAMGRVLEAERLLASPLTDVIEASRAGKRITPSLVDQAARFSAKLATATGKGAWADYVIELYAAQQRPAPAPVIDELYNALRRVTSIDLQRLRDYIEQLRLRLARFGPADRFLIQRLEGLERLANLR